MEGGRKCLVLSSLGRNAFFMEKELQITILEFNTIVKRVNKKMQVR